MTQDNILDEPVEVKISDDQTGYLWAKLSSKSKKIIKAHIASEITKSKKRQLDTLIDEEVELYKIYGDDRMICVGIKIMADAVRGQYDVI